MIQVSNVWRRNTKSDSFSNGFKTWIANWFELNETENGIIATMAAAKKSHIIPLEYRIWDKKEFNKIRRAE